MVTSKARLLEPTLRSVPQRYIHHLTWKYVQKYGGTAGLQGLQEDSEYHSESCRGKDVAVEESQRPAKRRGNGRGRDAEPDQRLQRH